jgi:hypothetical protein
MDRCRRPSNRWSAGTVPWPPVTSAAPAPISTRRSASLPRSSVSRPVSACASGRFGVTTVASGNSRPISVSTASGSSSRAPELAIMTGSTTSGRRRPASSSATASMIGEEKSMPVLAAPAPMSSRTAAICARTKPGGSCSMAVTPRVFCAVSATMADIPCAPQRANAFRSAWMPAPPPESDEAIVSTRAMAVTAAPALGLTRPRASGAGCARPRRRPGPPRPPAPSRPPSARGRPPG